MDLTSPAPLSLSSLLINLCLGLVLSTFVAWYYKNYSNSFTNRSRFSPLLPLLTLTTVLVISVVKSSLALSLGLVGALSIVRFRTAIKEPEELLFLFLAITIGLGLGADQRIPTLLAVAVIMTYLFIRRKMKSDRGMTHNMYLNLAIAVTDNDTDGNVFSRANDILLKQFDELNMRRLDANPENLQITYFLSVTKQDDLIALMDELKEPVSRMFDQPDGSRKYAWRITRMKITRSEDKPNQTKPNPATLTQRLAKTYQSPGVRILLITLVLLIGFSFGVYMTESRNLQKALAAINRKTRESLHDLRVEFLAYSENGLPTLYIDLPFESYNQIIEKRKEALLTGVLFTSDEDLVPCQISYQDGNQLDAELRLKGDWTDHLEGNKWSFRIHIKDDNQYINGMRRFSIQAPETRNFVTEWAFHQHLFSENILTTRYQFINVLINGEPKGIYALEESFSQELLESQEQRQGIILHFDEDLMWKNTATFMEAGGNALLDQVITTGFFMNTDMETSEVDVFREGYITKHPELKEQAAAAIGLLRAFQTGQRAVSDLFDVKSLGRFYALSDLWGAGHTTRWHNIRFYYNPITGLLEPIAYDTIPLSDWWLEDQLAYPFENNALFNDPEIKAAYTRELERITDPDYLIDLQNSLKESTNQIQDTLAREYSSIEFTSIWDVLQSRRLMLEKQLHPPKITRGYATYDPDQKSIRVDLVNLTVLPQQLLEIEVNGKVIPIDPAWFDFQNSPSMINDNGSLIFRGSENLHEASFEMPISETITSSADLQVTIWSRIYGLKQTYREALITDELSQVLINGPSPIIPSLEECLSQHPFLFKTENRDQLIVQSGDWDVIGDLIIPKNMSLIIPQGTTLRFEPQRILFSKGPVHIKGTSEYPVLLTSQGSIWGGIVILDAGLSSRWEHLRIENTEGISRSGWQLTGGITFYKSPLEITHVQIAHSLAEDALNIVHSVFSLSYCEISNTSSDALDADFAEGEISNCSFINIEGDAVDTSGSVISLVDSSFHHIRDKAVSAGENSQFTASNLYISDVGIGIASKDISNVSITNSTIDSAEVAGFAAYVKKKPVWTS